MKAKLNNKGFGSVEMVLMVVVVAAIVGVGAYVLGKGHATQPSTTTNTAASTTKTSTGSGTLAVSPSSPTIGSTFNVTATYTVPKGEVPEESVVCQQNGVQTFLDVRAENETSSTGSPWVQQWDLTSASMTDYMANNPNVPANCTVDLYYFTWTGHRETGYVMLSTTSFTAQP